MASDRRRRRRSRSLRDDPAFLADPGHHPAMFADHGIVHARDVAIGVVRLVDVVDGVLLPGRPPARRAFVTALGVATAYLHDDRAWST